MIRIVQPPDRGCPFLDPADSFCSIHKEKGIEAKPHSCRVWPYLFIPFDNEGVTFAFQATCANTEVESDTPPSLEDVTQTYKLWDQNDRIYLPAYRVFFDLFKNSNARPYLSEWRKKLTAFENKSFNNEREYLRSWSNELNETKMNVLEKEILNYYFEEKNDSIPDLKIQEQHYYFALIQQTFFDPAAPLFMTIALSNQSQGIQSLFFFAILLKVVAQRLAFYAKKTAVDKDDFKLAKDYLHALRAHRSLDQSTPILNDMRKLLLSPLTLREKVGSKIAGYFKSEFFSPADYF